MVNLKWFSESDKQVSLYRSGDLIIHAEILDSTRWLVWHFKAKSDKRVILRQGKNRYPRTACEQFLANYLAPDEVAPEITQQAAKPTELTEFNKARNRIRLWASLATFIGASGLGFYHWLLFRPVTASMFMIILLALLVTTRQALRLWHGEITLSQVFTLGQGKSKQVSFHAKR